MTDRPTQSEYGVAVLAGYRIPIENPTPESNLARFQPKLTIGDHTRDSDDLISVWVQSSWLGGGQAFRLNAESQNERWWDGTLDTEHSTMLALQKKTHETYAPTGVTGLFTPLGDYDNVFYGSWGDNFCYWDANAEVWVDTTEDLNAQPVNRGVAYRGLFYVPCGANGLNSYNISGNTMANVQDAGPDNVEAISLEIWDNKLIALEVDGAYRVFNGTTWTNPSDDLTISDGSTPRDVVAYYDRSGAPAIYITTSRGMWGVDELNDVLVRGGGSFPPHPTQARGAAVWRTTDMFISTGTGVRQWNHDVFSPMGLDRNDGLRAELRGSIVDLYPEHNGLLALVRGTAQDDNNTLFLDDPMPVDGEFLMPSSSAFSSLWRWNSFGWHKVWESANANSTPTRMCVGSSEDGTRYDLWWGYGDVAFKHPLRIEFHNPQEGVRLGLDEFQESGWLRTGRWNANMPMWPKLASHLDVNLLPGSTGSVQIEYMTDQTSPNWVSMGTTSTVGQTRFYFGDDFIDASGRDWPIKTGIPFDWIEFRYTLDGVDGDPFSTPIIDSFVMKFIKVPLQILSWSFNIPLMFDEQFYDVGPNELYEMLTGLTSTQTFVPLVYKDKTYRVLVAQTQADRFGGDDNRARFSLIVLEVS